LNDVIIGTQQIIVNQAVRTMAMLYAHGGAGVTQECTVIAFRVRAID
jgi:hypothetical protein